MDVLLTIISRLIAILAILGVGLFVFSRSTAKKVEAVLPPRAPLVRVSDAAIHAVKQGEGPPILFIHGLSGSLANFTHSTTGPLSADFTTIAIDRPGCGHSERDADEQARLPEQARLIAEFIETEGLEKPLIVGHSLGGAVALALAMNHPDKVGALGLIAPLTAVQDGPPGVFAALNHPAPLQRKLIANTLAVPMGIRNGPKALNVVFAPGAPPEDFSVRGGGLLNLRPKGFYAASTDMLAVSKDIHAIGARYGEIAAPIGMIYGDDDKVLHADTHIQAVLEAQPDMHLERLPGVGHMVQFCRPDETEAFIRTMASRRSA
jgi:pimeloyl-ACP methyl ester carboxylesterase